MSLSLWFDKYNISAQARTELAAILDYSSTPAGSISGTGREAGLQKAFRFAAAQRGIKLFRNNVGVAIDSRGIPVRYGLANESAQMQEILKSSDLIGLMPVTISQKDVGKVFAKFIAVETKRPGWEYTGTVREKAQKRFLDLVTSLGGVGVFVNSVGDCEYIR